MAGAFVIRPFNIKEDSAGEEIDFENVHAKLIQPALEGAGFRGNITTGEIISSGNIHEDMFKMIVEADIVVCDITIHNANVFYELGIRHALRKKVTVMIRGKESSDHAPFDIAPDRYFLYSWKEPEKNVDNLTKTLQASMKSDRKADSPVFTMLPDLEEANFQDISVVPPSFHEEVERARASKRKGWLALLAQDIEQLGWRWGGLKLVAKAQWDLEDWTGSAKSWEAVREMHPDDKDANLGLANIYERLFRKDKDVDTLTKSDHALDRILKLDLSAADRAETLALFGRNMKTRWRHEFEELDDADARRDAAMNQDLIEYYEAYHEAFMYDLNAYYPGLSALQAGTILTEFKSLDKWNSAFRRNRDAERFKEDLDEQVAALKVLVGTSVEAALDRMPRDDENRVWADISGADTLFLTSADEDRVVSAYLNAVPKDHPFAWNAASGQLKLFKAVGVKTALVDKIIAAVEARDARGAPEPEEPEAEVKEAAKPLHLIIVGGHCVDESDPERTERRFPSDTAGKASPLMEKQIKAITQDDQQVHVLASAAPGADVLAHEICSRLGLASTMVLPMPPDVFAKEVFGGLTDWRSRFINLTKSGIPLLQLSDKAGVPRWLNESDIDPWDRGNRWVMKLAETWGADRVSMVVLWDKVRGGEGGTAQMVSLAEGAGVLIDIKVVDSSQLLETADAQ